LFASFFFFLYCCTDEILLVAVAQVADKTKYAKWKAAEIIKALKEGRRPDPGPPGWSPEDDLAPPPPSDDNLGFSSGAGAMGGQGNLFSGNEMGAGPAMGQPANGGYGYDMGWSGQQQPQNAPPPMPPSQLGGLGPALGQGSFQHYQQQLQPSPPPQHGMSFPPSQPQQPPHGSPAWNQGGAPMGMGGHDLMSFPTNQPSPSSGHPAPSAPPPASLNRPQPGGSPNANKPPASVASPASSISSLSLGGSGGGGGAKRLDAKYLEQAERHIRHALSAIQFEDVPTTLACLAKAQAVLASNGGM
jgi:vacuolar protein sorting-associated protein VTA1